MAKLVSYQCDRCKYIRADVEQMWNIGISLTHVDTRQHAYNCAVVAPQMWCRLCCESIAVLHEPMNRAKAAIQAAAEAAKATPPPPPPTLEDMIKSIAQNLIEESQS